MRDRILEILKGRKSLGYEEIKDVLGDMTSEEFIEMNKAINELEDEALIYKSNKNKYSLFSDTNLKRGILRVNKKGFGFVDLQDEEDVYIARDNMNKAIHNDEVIAEIIPGNKVGKLEGRIVRIVNRESNRFVGEYRENERTGYILLDETNVNMRIDITEENSMGAMNGHKVLVEVIRDKNNGYYDGKVLKILGHKNDPGVDILSIVYKYDINDEFSADVMKEVESMPEEIDQEEIKNRRDLRDKTIITIDGLDAKDLDDAISIEKKENGNYLLGVHIADVSYYVKPGSKLDDEAYDRGTSVYLADRVIPMLPHRLSNGICSLNGGVDRFTMTCDMEIDSKGEVVEYDIYPSVINSTKRCDYDSVNSIIERNVIVEGYEEIEGMLRTMYELSLIIRKARERRGSIDFDNDEVKVIVDESGKAIDIKRRDRGEGEKLIEDFMIAANETVATHVYNMEYPFVYRIHEYPKTEKVEQFLKFVSLFGYNVKGSSDYKDPKNIQAILDQLKDKKEIDIFSTLLLRSMKKAIYSPENKGHFGLASKCYTHFTSPIRRYPDTTVHRLLRTYLVEKKMDVETLDYYKKYLVPMTEHSSKKERDAQDCEREVDDMKMAEYMMDHIGEEYDGIISSVMNFGMFVMLPNLIEGLVHIKEMKDDYYTYDETTLTLRGDKNKKGYRVGDTIRVKATAASKEEKTIDFEIVKK